MTYRVMTVCTGNICRSPMAEIVLRHRLEAAGLADEVVVDSSGVSDEEHGNPVDRRARQVLATRGYPTGDGHRAHRITPDELTSRDLILVATAQHARTLRRMDPDVAERVVMLRSFDPAAPTVTPGGPEYLLDLDDPWYGGMREFEQCLTQIEAAADGVLAHLRTTINA